MIEIDFLKYLAIELFNIRRYTRAASDVDLTWNASNSPYFTCFCIGFTSIPLFRIDSMPSTTVWLQQWPYRNSNALGRLVDSNLPLGARQLQVYTDAPTSRNCYVIACSHARLIATPTPQIVSWSQLSRSSRHNVSIMFPLHFLAIENWKKKKEKRKKRLYQHTKSMPHSNYNTCHPHDKRATN